MWLKDQAGIIEHARDPTEGGEGKGRTTHTWLRVRRVIYTALEHIWTNSCRDLAAGDFLALATSAWTQAIAAVEQD